MAERRAWGEPLARFDAGWTRFESRIAAGVLIAEIALLFFWISLRALSSETTEQNFVGVLYRSAVLGAAVGAIAWVATKKRTVRDRRIAAAVGIVVGVWIGRATAN